MHSMRKMNSQSKLSLKTKRKLCFVNTYFSSLSFFDVDRGDTDGKYDRYNLFFSLALSRHQKDQEAPGESGFSNVFRSQQLKHDQLIPQPVKQIQPDNSRAVQIDDLLCL